MQRRVVIKLILALTLPGVVLASTCQPKRDASGRIARKHYSVERFQLAHPCPSTGKRYGRCPGFVVDHIVPLCACGDDAPQNMQWQTVEDAKRKDRQERRQCIAGSDAQPETVANRKTGISPHGINH